MKYLFLDIDGVLNSVEWFKRRTKEQQFSNICELDIEAMLLFDEIVERTNCRVVLSSTWRLSNTWREDLERQGLNTNFIIDRTGSCNCRIRGSEIHEWINKNIPWEQRRPGGSFRYAILDDDSDMLLWQKDDFFKTSNDTGLTREIAEAVIAHLNNGQELPHEAKEKSV